MVTTSSHIMALLLGNLATHEQLWAALANAFSPANPSLASGHGPRYNLQMHLNLACMQCSATGNYKPVAVEIETHGLYAFACVAGHRSVYHLANARFEVLLDGALMAYSDGYTREAVTTFAAAAEDFFRLFIATVLTRDQMRRMPQLPELKPFWKLVSRAEPQLGAFVALYMLEKGDVPTFPDQK